MADRSWRDFYGSEAERYETARYGSRYGSAFRTAHRSLIDRMLEGLIGQVSTSLDVATGTGQLLPCLAALSNDVVAVDLTPEMMRVSRRVNPSSHITYLQANALRLPFGDATFDLVVSSRFLHLFERSIQHDLIAEMVRVCRPGGVVVVDFYNSMPRKILAPLISMYRRMANKRKEQDHYSTPAEAVRMLSANGLDCVRSHGVGSYAMAPLLWLPAGLRSALMTTPLFANQLLAEQWVLAGRRI